MSALDLLARGVDAIAVRAIAWRSPSARRRSRSESLGPDARMDALARIARVYGSGNANDADTFFGAPVDVAVREAGQGDTVDLSWDSAFEPIQARDAYLAHAENRRAYARLHRVRGQSSRSVAVLVHGYAGGRFELESRIGERILYERAGLDTALFVLPHHGLRGRPGRRPRFPASDPSFTNEAIRQSIFDLRNLLRHLRARGAEQVVVHGTSLGGYVAALLGTVEPLDALVPMIPLASFADVALGNGRLTGTPHQQRAQHAALEAAHRSVSPFARPPRVAADRVIVVAGEADGVTGMGHARRIATHFDAELARFSGGHVVQIGKEACRARVREKLRGLGIGR